MENGLLPDRTYMRRALQLAAKGLGHVSPNPMVGAVIVGPDGRILGEGYHRRYGEAHAEVNAVASVGDADRALLPESTIYVTLEPCCHFGKTPPCADLILRTGIRRVVVGATDPFEKVDGGGIRRLREAGVDVRTGIEEAACRCLNARFFTAHTQRRPFVTLKWAQSSDGYMDIRRDPAVTPSYRFSTPEGETLVHRLRSHHDAILVGSRTFINDRPRLDVRLWPGRSPQRIIADRSGRIDGAYENTDVASLLARLYAEGVTSVLVEGGAAVLRSFIDAGLWDVARVEVAPIRLSERGAVKAPLIPSLPVKSRPLAANTLYYYSNNPLVDTYFIENGF